MNPVFGGLIRVPDRADGFGGRTPTKKAPTSGAF